MAPKTPVENLKKELLELLLSAESSLAYHIDGALPTSDLPDPEIDVVGHGRLSCPLRAEDLAKLKQASNQIDVNNNIWIVEASKIRIQNKQWRQKVVVESCLQAVSKQFGIRPGINARFVNLTIYGNGSNFAQASVSASHSDAFGRLQVILPFLYVGGKTSLQHDERVYHHDTAKDSTTKLVFSATYLGVKAAIEEILDGHKVVLRYELIQRTDIPMFQPKTAEWKANIKQVFEKWNVQLEHSPKTYPAFILHHIDFDDEDYATHNMWQKRKFPEMSRCLASPQITSLKSVCSSIGFKLYVARLTKNRHVTFPPDYGCLIDGREVEDYFEVVGEYYEEEEVSYEFEAIYSLAGKEQNRRLDCQPLNLLQDVDTDGEGCPGDGDYDAMDYTGEATVLIIVPRVQALYFELLLPDRLEFGSAMLDELHNRACIYPDAEKQMRELCKALALLVPPIVDDFNFLWAGARNHPDGEVCLNHIADIRRQKGWMQDLPAVRDGFGGNMSKMKDSAKAFMAETLPQKGAKLHEIWEGKTCLAWRYQLLREAKDVLDSCVHTEEHSVKVARWYGTALAQMLTSSGKATIYDAAAIATIANSCDIDITSSILMRVGDSNPLTLAAIFTAVTEAVMSTTKTVSPAKPTSIIEFLGKTSTGRLHDKMIAEFRYSGPQTKSHDRAYRESLPNGIAVVKNSETLTVRSLNAVMMVAIARDIQEGTNCRLRILHAWRDAVIHVDSAYLAGTLLCFITGLVQRGIKAMKIPDDFPSNSVAFSSYIASVLHHFITRRVGGPEPRSSEKSHREWKHRHEAARSRLSLVFRYCMPELEKCLGPHYEAIMSCYVERLPGLKELASIGSQDLIIPSIAASEIVQSSEAQDDGAPGNAATDQELAASTKKRKADASLHVDVLTHGESESKRLQTFEKLCR